MNIYALQGHKVVCSTLNGGYDSDEELAVKYLELNKEYTVLETNVSGWHTDVILEEFPDIEFNSVFFEDVDEQDEESDMEHPDYSYYND